MVRVCAAEYSSHLSEIRGSLKIVSVTHAAGLTVPLLCVGWVSRRPNLVSKKVNHFSVGINLALSQNAVFARPAAPEFSFVPAAGPAKCTWLWRVWKLLTISWQRVLAFQKSCLYGRH